MSYTSYKIPIKKGGLSYNDKLDKNTKTKEATHKKNTSKSKNTQGVRRIVKRSSDNNQIVKMPLL